MTWVVGASSIFGYGVMISDVRVSWGDGTEIDLLRKSFRIAPFLLAGFAGSVHIGFQLIDDLQRFLVLPPGVQGVAWRPEWVAENWSPRAAEVFAASADEEKQLGSQIMIVGVSPDQDLGTPNSPRVFVIKFDWPHFEPVFERRGMSVCHIGSGSGIESFKEAIAENFKLSSPNLQIEIVGPGAWAHMLGHSVGRLVEDNPVDGISSHVHINICRRGDFMEANNDETRHHLDGKRVEFIMPKVASTYEEFRLLCKKYGKGAAKVIA